MRENYWTRRRFSRRTVLKASAAGAVGAGRAGGGGLW